MLKYRLDKADWQACPAATTLTISVGETIAFDLASGGNWYGHGFSHIQPYPLNHGTVVNAQFAVNNIQCPIWLCSAGYALLAETLDRLAVTLNAANDGLLQITPLDAPVTLRIFHGPNLPTAQAALLHAVGWPNRPPAADLLGDALFCTWTQYPRCLTQARILDYAKQIRAHDYPCSTLIIDDRWESCFGELTFAPEFSDPTGMVRALHDLGFQVWLWVTPFVNEEAATFADLERHHLLVPQRDGSGAARLRWWGGTAGLIDLTNPAARDWYRNRLLALKNTIGIDGFKIDGGDFKYQPAPANAAWHGPCRPSEFSDRLLALFEEIVPNQCETRTAWLSQRRSVIWREGGKDSHWGLDNGLAALVTLAQHLALLGYDLLIPDMVPGRVQTMVSDMPLPTDELMVRWTEATALLPIMQFSYAPWNYAPATERIVRAYAHLHKRLQGYLVAAATARRVPLLRPLW